MTTFTPRAAVACLALAAAAGAQTYGYSDGQAERSLGLVTGGTTAWFQSFDTDDHTLSVDRIVEIASANGSSIAAGAPPGSTGGVAVYQDPNDDSIPFDLAGSDLLATATWVVQSNWSTQLERTLICPNPTVTGKFWIAAWLAHGPNQQPAPIDTSVPSSGRSWMTTNLIAFDPDFPNGNGNTPFIELSTLGPLFDGVWVMTANHEPATIYVDLDAMGANDGSSWNDAFLVLQDALCLAHAGDDVWVAEGSYYPDRGIAHALGDITERFRMESGVAVYGGFQGGETSLQERDWEAYPATLSGDLNQDDTPGFGNYGDNSCHVVQASSVDAGAILDGFVLRSGHAVNQGGCTDRGGGLLVSGGAPLIRNCVFTGNYGNVAAGLNLNATDASVLDCLFLDNYGYYAAGAINVSGSGDPWLQDCRFLGNTAHLQRGGAMLVEVGGSPTLVNCLLGGNSAGTRGGAIALYKDPASVKLINCTLYGNVAATGGGVYVGSSTSAEIANSILCLNADGGGSDESGQIHVLGSASLDFSNVQGWTWTLGGVGNVAGDPRLVDAGGPDAVFGTLDDMAWLLPGSVCVNAGDDDLVPTGVVEDLGGAQRIQSVQVDMGAYESPYGNSEKKRASNRPGKGFN